MISSSRILIVDDDAQVGSALELILAAGQFEEIILASDAEQAMDILDLAHDDIEVPPCVDVILLDIMMPGLDGIQACARIRQTRRYRDTPIIMCTGVGQTSALNQAFIAGADDYLVKPIKSMELLARVRSAMRFKRELDRRRMREEQLRSAQRGERKSTGSYVDDNTGLPNRFAFERAMHQAISGGHSHGVVALQIAGADAHRREAGHEAADDLTAMVARAIASLQAPLDWKLYIFGRGLFMVLAPSGSAEQIALLGKRAAGAIDALRIVHGHSLDEDFIRLTFAAGRGQGTELLTLPASVIRALDHPDKAPAIISDSQTRAA